MTAASKSNGQSAAARVSTKRNRACEPLTAQEFDKIDEVVFELPNVVDIAAAPPRLIVPT